MESCSDTRRNWILCAKRAIRSFFCHVPEGITVLLTADRFYGTSSLIQLCQRFGWKYRIRLRRNLILLHEGGEIQNGDILKFGLSGIENATLNQSGVVTHIGVLHEKGHSDPWIIAMDEKPSKGRVLDYGMRWGIEALFSDMKTRGFGITKTHLKESDRIERLMLILSVASYWAVSTGMRPKPSRSKKKEERSLVSYFKQRLRYILDAIIYLKKIEPLWKYLNFVRC